MNRAFGLAHLLTRPVGRPSNEVRRSYASFSYQTGSWTKPRRSSPRACPAKARPTMDQGGPRARSNGRGRRLSCRSFAANAVRLQPSRAPLQPREFFRARLAHARTDQGLVADDAQGKKLIKIGAKVVGHARYVTFQMAEIAISKNRSPRVYE